MLRRLLAFLTFWLVAASAVGARAAGPCHTNADLWRDQGLSNAISYYSLEWAPFGAVEWGWETYLPLIQHEIHTQCFEHGKMHVDLARTDLAAAGHCDARLAKTPNERT